MNQLTQNNEQRCKSAQVFVEKQHGRLNNIVSGKTYEFRDPVVSGKLFSFCGSVRCKCSVWPGLFRFSFVLWLIKSSAAETPLSLSLSSKHSSYRLLLINSCFPSTLLCAIVTSLSPFSLVILWIQVLWRIYPSRDIWKVLSKLLEPLI